MIAQVEPLTTARALKGPFDYLVPEDMSISVGSILEVPFAGRKILGVVTALSEHTDVPAEKLASPLRTLDASVPEVLTGIGLWVGEQYCSTAARGLSLVTPPGIGTGAGRAGAKKVLVASITDAGRAALGGAERLNENQRNALAALDGLPDGVIAAQAGETIGVDTSGLRRLEKRGLVAIEQRESRRAPRHQAIGKTVDRPELTADQEKATARVTDAIDHGFADLLLHGVTGSGKTEVYLRAAEHALERGGSVIVMVPEIALTPQLVTRFESRFGEGVALLHSQMSSGERHDEWLRLRRGEARVAIGPRSAVFAPVQNLKLLIVDEEHDGSYKQDGDPRYDARDVALERARRERATLLSGSATPRAEAWERSQRIDLPRRVDGSPMPPVELIDMAGQRAALHPDVAAALAKVAARGEKAIVLLNRRGWSNFLSCQNCGHTWICPNCDVTLVLHMQNGEIACHHCGHHERLPQHCPECESEQIARHGTGTERLEHELREAIGHSTRIFRLDADTAARKGVANVLGAFEEAEGGVLIGTQMVAKGHDFPDVTLAVVVDADSTLNFPDFRAEERTFALVAQLAGRSGRGSADGRVMVQTRSPDTRSLRHAAQHDSTGFVNEELRRRDAFGYPPFARIVKIQTASPEYTAAQSAADALADAIGDDAGRLLGPIALFKRKGLERFQIEIKSFDPDAVVTSVREAVELVAASPHGRDVKFAVDVDPQ